MEGVEGEGEGMIEYTTKVGAHDWDGFTELEMWEGGGERRGAAGQTVRG